MDRFSHKVIIISRNLDGFSLTNHRRFAKFAKLFPRQTFSLYGIHMYVCITIVCVCVCVRVCVRVCVYYMYNIVHYIRTLRTLASVVILVVLLIHLVSW